MSFPAFVSVAQSLAPKTAIVLGSGLGRVVDRLAIISEVSFADVPGFAVPTVHGHSGRILVGSWSGVPVLVFQGRMHYYEGNPWDRVTLPVKLAADIGVKVLILTNAAGGISGDLNPGNLMAIRDHVELLNRDAWRTVSLRSASRLSESPYSARLIERLTKLGLPSGTYAALTGPCYETPAEIRALAAMGADAVGMSTAREAEAGLLLGLEVAAISCVTNKAAGLAPGPLDHKEVLQTAAAPAERLANLIGQLVVP